MRGHSFPDHGFEKLTNPQAGRILQAVPAGMSGLTSKKSCQGGYGRVTQDMAAQLAGLLHAHARAMLDHLSYEIVVAQGGRCIASIR